jgi:hypothetical protein
VGCGEGAARWGWARAGQRAIDPGARNRYDVAVLDATNHAAPGGTTPATPFSNSIEAAINRLRNTVGSAGPPPIHPRRGAACRIAAPSAEAHGDA